MKQTQEHDTRWGYWPEELRSGMGAEVSGHCVHHGDSLIFFFLIKQILLHFLG